MELEELLKKKENLLIRFSRLTEEAMFKIENEKEEDLPLTMEKREKLIKEMEIVQGKLKKTSLKPEQEDLKIKQLEARMLAQNKELQEKMEKHFHNLKKNIGNNKKAIKINRAYQGQLGQFPSLDKKN